MCNPCTFSICTFQTYRTLLVLFWLLFGDCWALRQVPFCLDVLTNDLLESISFVSWPVCLENESIQQLGVVIDSIAYWCHMWTFEHHPGLCTYRYQYLLDHKLPSCGIPQYVGMSLSCSSTYSERVWRVLSKGLHCAQATEIRMCAGFQSEFCEMIPISLIGLRKVCWSLMTVVKGLLVIHVGGAPQKEKQIQGEAVLVDGSRWIENTEYELCVSNVCCILWLRIFDFPIWTQTTISRSCHNCVLKCSMHMGLTHGPAHEHVFFNTSVFGSVWDYL